MPWLGKSSAGRPWVGIVACTETRGALKRKNGHQSSTSSSITIIIIIALITSAATLAQGVPGQVLMAEAPSRGSKRRHDGRQARAGSLASASSVAGPPGHPESLDLGTFDSSLALKLLKDWSWGRLSSKQVQEFAACSHKAEIAMLNRLNLSHEYASKSVGKLASLGDSGRHPGNTHRDLLAFLGEPRAPSPHCTRAPCKPGKRSSLTDEITSVNIPFMLPHEALAYLFQACRSRFDTLFLVTHTILMSSRLFGKRW